MNIAIERTLMEDEAATHNESRSREFVACLKSHCVVLENISVRVDDGCILHLLEAGAHLLEHVFQIEIV